MDVSRRISAPEANHLTQRVAELRGKLRVASPIGLAMRSGARYLATEDSAAGGGAAEDCAAEDCRGTFELAVWGRDVSLAFPGFTGRYVGSGDELSTFDLALLAYYFDTSDGAEPSGRWISFSELPDGRFYAQAFEGYTGRALARAFGEDSGGFDRAATESGGHSPESPLVADRAYIFQALPLVPLQVACWPGDEDFPSSYRILFDAAVSHHLPTDACAILGSALTRRLVRAYEALKNDTRVADPPREELATAHKEHNV